MSRHFIPNIVWVCSCGHWYSGDKLIDIWLLVPTDDECHRWDCGWKHRNVAFTIAKEADEVVIHA